MSKLTITIVIEEFKTVFKLLKVENYDVKNYLKIVMTIYIILKFRLEVHENFIITDQKMIQQNPIVNIIIII